MMNREKIEKTFPQLNPADLDLTMFIITNLTLAKQENANVVYMALKLKRKVATELLNTPTSPPSSSFLSPLSPSSLRKIYLVMPLQ